MKIKQLIDHLKTHNDSEDEIAYMLWTVDDVQTLCDSREIDLTEEEKRQVIQLVDKRADAELGISWNTLYYAIDAIKED